MLTISRIEVNHTAQLCTTDVLPVFGFTLESNRPGEALKEAIITCGDWHAVTTEQTGIRYTGELQPFTSYVLTVKAEGTSGDTATAHTSFMTGRLDTPWQGKWITNKRYKWPEKTSPVPMVFRRCFTLSGEINRAWINATALGIYDDLTINGQRVSEDYFAPGFTSYKHQIQYQTYDITALLKQENSISVTVAGGWAAGSFHYNRKSHIATKHPALLIELWIEYPDGHREVVATNESWEVAQDGPVRMADWYDGEIYDANQQPIGWQKADMIKPQGQPKLLAQYGLPVRVIRTLEPVSCIKLAEDRTIYDFGQNFAGVICAEMGATVGQVVTFRHAEALDKGELYVKNLRTAKATLIYTCCQGKQCYSPRYTFMGFRYVEVSGIAADQLTLTAKVLCSDLPQTGAFSCSNVLVQRLYENCWWSAVSNFVDIPTDCPQRDERMGWTGDISIFAPTASKMFDMSRFFDKWLLDLNSEQSRSGGLPAVIPQHGDPVPKLPTACWGDCCIFVPWAEYMARGDRNLLARQYPVIKKYLRSVQRWAALGGNGHKKYIWDKPFSYGDWCAPYGYIKDWMNKGPCLATPFFAQDCLLAAQIAEILGHYEDAAAWRRLRTKIIDAFFAEFTDGNGKMLDEYQSAYVLPLTFSMAEGELADKLVQNLVDLIRRDGGTLNTGFPATPHLLFALSDHGRIEDAYALLMQEKAPGWLYAVKAGGTTIWEQWAPVLPDGSIDPYKEASLNHYAYGAVADWLYRRVLGIEALEAGYREYRIAPLVGGGITWARGHVDTPYGRVTVDWQIQENTFTLRTEVPVSATCHVILPDRQQHTLQSGIHTLCCTVE